MKDDEKSQQAWLYELDGIVTGHTAELGTHATALATASRLIDAQAAQLAKLEARIEVLERRPSGVRYQ